MWLELLGYGGSLKFQRPHTRHPMKVLKAGLVHEYKNYDSSEHCEAHIRCLEVLDPVAGARVRGMANAEISRYGSIRHATSDLQKLCSGLLDTLAPTGMYFGIPSVRSNMMGFWPSAWIEGETPRNPKGVPDAVARTLGQAVIG